MSNRRAGIPRSLTLQDTYHLTNYMRENANILWMVIERNISKSLPIPIPDILDMVYEYIGSHSQHSLFAHTATGGSDHRSVDEMKDCALAGQEGGYLGPWYLVFGKFMNDVCQRYDLSPHIVQWMWSLYKKEGYISIGVPVSKQDTWSRETGWVSYPIPVIEGKEEKAEESKYAREVFTATRLISRGINTAGMIEGTRIETKDLTINNLRSLVSLREIIEVESLPSSPVGFGGDGFGVARYLCVHCRKEHMIELNRHIPSCPPSPFSGEMYNEVIFRR